MEEGGGRRQCGGEGRGLARGRGGVTFGSAPGRVARDRHTWGSIGFGDARMSGATGIERDEGRIGSEGGGVGDGGSSVGQAAEPAEGFAEASPSSVPEHGATPDATGAPAAARRHFWLRSTDQWLVAGILTVVCLLLLWHWARLSGWGMRPVEIERLPERRYDYRIDINSATWVEWMQLPEIGETLALRIVEDRQSNGPFRSIDDLQRVKGIGPKTVEAIRPWLKSQSQVEQSNGRKAE